MALIHENVFVENILDDPDELEQVEDGEIIREREGEEVENDELEIENIPEETTPALKKKRKTSQKPRLNVLRLMSEKNGLMSAIKIFENVKLKGKGYELDDLSTIMRKLEIWAHQLYPSMQFDDCLAQLEKLGNTRPVVTYVTKIRMGLEDLESKPEDNIEGDSGDEVQNESTDNDFDRLINTQNRQTSSQSDNCSSMSLGLTAEQRERMLRNRLIAEQRRLARMKARQEQLLAKESNIKNCEPTVEISAATVPAKVNDDIVTIDSNSVEGNDAVDKDIPMEYTLDDNSKITKSNTELSVTDEADQSLEQGQEIHLEIQDGNVESSAL